jgi:plastocyanin
VAAIGTGDLPATVEERITMHLSRFLKSVFAIALLVLASGFIMGQRGALAQDEESHPAHIHSGTCGDGLGDVVFPLSNVSESVLVNGTPIAGATGGATDAIPVAVSGTTVPSSLADLLASPYAINIHESAENIGNYIACGNIGGTMIGASDLAIGLGELNESGYTGVATLHDNGDGTTAVSVYLTEEYSAADTETGEDMGTPAMEEGMDMGTPASDQSADTAAAAQVAVSIVNFAYDPNPVTVNVGDTITWTNNDGVPHTVTANDGSFQSGTLQPGQTFSFTFTAPGSIDYHCEFHANMSGQVVVQ